MAHGIEAIKRWQTAEDLISIENKDGDIDTIPIKRVPNSLFPKLFKIGLKIQNDSNSMTEEDIKSLVGLVVTSITSANEGVSREEAESFVYTRFSEVLPKFMEVNGGNINMSTIPDDVKQQLED